VEKAEQRVRDAISEGGKLKRVAELPGAMEEELAVYAAARMIISSAANRYLISRYSVAEAKRTRDYLDSDEPSHPQYLDEVASDFDVKFEKSGEGFLLPLAPYLAFTPRSVDYKLTNRMVAAGKVQVKKSERRRILEEAVRKRIEASLPIRAEFPKEIQEAGRRVLALLPKLEATIVRVGQENYPPCIKKLLEDLSLNVNVPHTGRVALAIYLVNAGVPDNKIVECFRHAPDFSEKTTGYQVQHVRARKYRMASCSTMDSWGICIADCHCGSPLNYRDGVHGRRLRRAEEEKK
jgi:DNA primase large subunit